MYAIKCNFSIISIIVSIIQRVYNRPYLLIFIVIIVPTQSSIFLRWYCNIACVVNYLNCNQSSNPPLNAINRFAKTQFVNYWRELILMLTRSHTRNDWKYSIPFDQRNLWYEHVWNRRYDLFYSNYWPTKYLRLKCNYDKVSSMLS